jgi:D-glycero-D-manno-heptose 1,7-bisphosphate phosphatase
MVRQCVILVGGSGTRLAPLTLSTPKPLLPVACRPFLDHLLTEVARHGFRDIVLLAGYRGDQVTTGYAGRRRFANREIDIKVLVEPEPRGTGGALAQLKSSADQSFLLMNGDSWFDIDLRAWVSRSLPPGRLARLALRRTADPERYGVVGLESGLITEFVARNERSESGLMNCGIYHVDRQLLEALPSHPCSLEADILPRLAAARRLEGQVMDGFFLDIGVPKDYAEAGRLAARWNCRPAVFVDPGALLITQDGPPVWHAGAREAVRELNVSGYYVFVATDSAIADDRCRVLEASLAEVGAHLDDRPDRLPALLQRWTVDLPRSWCAGAGNVGRDLPTYPTCGASFAQLVGDQLARNGPVRAATFPHQTLQRQRPE